MKPSKKKKPRPSKEVLAKSKYSIAPITLPEAPWDKVKSEENNND